MFLGLLGDIFSQLTVAEKIKFFCYFIVSSFALLMVIMNPATPSIIRDTLIIIAVLSFNAQVCMHLVIGVCYQVNETPEWED